MTITSKTLLELLFRNQNRSTKRVFGTNMKLKRKDPKPIGGGYREIITFRVSGKVTNEKTVSSWVGIDVYSKNPGRFFVLSIFRFVIVFR